MNQGTDGDLYGTTYGGGANGVGLKLFPDNLRVIRAKT